MESTLSQSNSDSTAAASKIDSGFHCEFETTTNLPGPGDTLAKTTDEVLSQLM